MGYAGQGEAASGAPGAWEGRDSQRKAKSSWIRSAKDTGPQLPMHLKGRSGKSPTNVHLEVCKTSSGIQIFDLSTQRFCSNKGG